MCWLDVSLSVRQARALSSALHLMEVLLGDQTRDDEKTRRSWLLEVSVRCESGIGIFPVVICVNPASAFQHQGQTGTSGWR